MTDRCWIDTETYCETPLNWGTSRYAEDVEVMLVTYGMNKEPIKCWDVTGWSPMPSVLYDALCDSSIELWAHNSFFDRLVMRANFGKYICYDLGIERWRCTMAQAYAHGLPGALGTLGDIFGLGEGERKLDGGRELIQLFCKPPPKNFKRPRATSKTHPEEWQRFIDYAIRDSESMRVLAGKMPSWNYPDNPEVVQSWLRDQHINDHGAYLDLEFAEAAVRATTKAKRQLASQTKDQTDGYVERATQRDKLLAYLLLEYNVELPDMKADTIERRLNDENLPDYVKDLLVLRLQSSKTSQTKYKKAMNAVNADGYARGLLQWCGAARTGRWAGRILQPQNFPRPRPGTTQEMIERFIDAVNAGCEDLLYD